MESWNEFFDDLVFIPAVIIAAVIYFFKGDHP